MAATSVPLAEFVRGGAVVLAAPVGLPLLHETGPEGFSFAHLDFHPEIVAGLLLLQVGYLLGVGPLRKWVGGVGRIDRRQAALFSLGTLALAVALLPPLHDLSEEGLFSAHMVQHLLLVLVAGPLLLAGTPHWLLRPLLRPRPVALLARFFTHALVAFVVFNVVFMVWHFPGLYDAALRHDWLHALEHVTLLVSAVLMWCPILSPLPALPRISYPLRMVYFFLLALAQTPLFALITFSNQVLYQAYADVPRMWGLSAVADQQLGGAIMKVGSVTVFLGATVIIFFRWFNREEASDLDGPQTPDADPASMVNMPGQ